MNRNRKWLLARLFAAVIFLVTPLGSAALAQKDGLLLPGNADANVELILKENLVESEPSTLLSVFVGGKGECCSGKLPLAGSYLVEGHKVIFDPAFDFLEGKTYTVVSHGDVSLNQLRHEYELTEFVITPTGKAENPEVVAIYPSGDEIPENTLRFYIHFSVAMKPHVSNQFIKLIDSEGRSDTAAFMDFKQELWSEDRKRLTLLVDPGRIKRGVAQNLSLGPALREGESFSIVIDSGWQTTDGETISGFENRFTVSEALRTRPNPDHWTMEPPRIFTNDPLIIKFDRTFDHELLQRAIAVTDKDGQPIQGMVSIDNQEKLWRFDPNSVWKNTQMLIAVDTLLEDVAGNNLRELLDHPVETETHITSQKIMTLALTPSPIQRAADNN